MTSDLFGAPTGPGYDKMDGSAPGSEGYENNIVNRASRSLKPAYQSAMRGLNDQFAGRGLQDSGMAGEAQGALTQDYLDKLGGISETAATHGSDVNEENRRREEQRGWQVQDRDMQMAWLKEQAKAAKDAADNAQWADLIGGTAGAAGSYFAGPVGGAAAKTVADDGSKYASKGSSSWGDQ